MKYDKKIQVATAQNATKDGNGDWVQNGGSQTVTIACQVNSSKGRKVRLNDGTIVDVQCEIFLPKRSPAVSYGASITVLNDKDVALFTGRVVQTDECKLSTRVHVDSVLTFETT